MVESRMPQDISKTDWYYERPGHIMLVHEVRDPNGEYIRTDQIKIPWRMLEKSHARRSKPRKVKR
jgi:hypothetical protein